VLCVKTDSNYFSDLASKVCSVALDKPIWIRPYSFTTEDGKLKKGVTVMQDGEKVKSKFYDGKKNLHGFPVVDKEKQEKFKKDYWKMFFKEVELFLVEQMNLLDIVKPDAQTPVEAVENKPSTPTPDEVVEENLPF